MVLRFPRLGAFIYSMELDGITVFGILIGALCLLLGISRHLDTSIRRQRRYEKLER
jgi:hypothetical protein